MKYIVANLKSSLNDNNINDYIDVINNINSSNLVICPDKKYIDLFKDKYTICTQDYYEDIKTDYCLIGHYDNKNTSKQINEKIKKALKNNIKVILCIGNNNYNDLDSIKKQLNEYLIGIDNINDIIFAYEPYFMINTDNNIDYKNVEKNIINIRSYFYNNVKVFYGGNVNLKSITKILKICDGVLLGRSSFNPYNLTNILNKITKIQ